MGTIVYKIPVKVFVEGLDNLGPLYDALMADEGRDEKEARQEAFLRALGMYQDSVDVYRSVGGVYRAYAAKPVVYSFNPHDLRHAYVVFSSGYKSRGESIRPVLKGEDLLESGRAQKLSDEEVQALYAAWGAMPEESEDDFMHWSHTLKSPPRGVALPDDFVPDSSIPEAKISPRFGVQKLGILPLYTVAANDGNKEGFQVVAKTDGNFLASGEDIADAANSEAVTGPRGELQPKAVFSISGGDAQAKIDAYLERKNARKNAIEKYLNAVRAHWESQNEYGIGFSYYLEANPIILEATPHPPPMGKPPVEHKFSGFVIQKEEPSGKRFIVPDESDPAGAELAELWRAIPEEEYHMTFPEYFGVDGVSLGRYGETPLLICRHDITDKQIAAIQAMSGAKRISSLGFSWILANAIDFFDKVAVPPAPAEIKQELEDAGIVPADEGRDLCLGL